MNDIFEKKKIEQTVNKEEKEKKGKKMKSNIANNWFNRVKKKGIRNKHIKGKSNPYKNTPLHT